MEVTTSAPDSDAIRRALVDRLTVPGIELSDVNVTPDGPTTHLELRLIVVDRDDTLFKAAMTPLMIEPRVASITWEALDDG